MATYTQFLGIEKLTQGQSGAHVTVNESFDAFDLAIAGMLEIDFVAHGSSTKTFSGWDNTSAIVRITNASSASTINVLSNVKTWTVINDSSHAVTMQISGQASPPSVAAGTIRRLVCDGTRVRFVG